MRRRRRSAVFPWNVDPLRSTTLRGIRSARSALGQRSFRSSALHRSSCHASVSVMLEKRSGRCRTDGPLRILSCQMRHTIAAIKATWCRSLYGAPFRRASDSASCERLPQLSGSAESLVTDAERRNRRVICLLHIISDVSRVRHAQGTTLSILRAFIACATAVQTAVLVLFGPSGLFGAL